MNEKIITSNITTSINEVRKEASRLTLLADTLEKATALLDVSPAMAAIKETINKASNTAHRLNETQRHQLDSWLKGGQKAVADMCEALGITRARVYQRRNELGLETYKRGSVGAGAAGGK